jgi:CDP-diacylglycerol--glycerol-3-phosphate 3-phosphatidyltransferase
MNKKIPKLLIIFRLILAPIIIITAYIFKNDAKIPILIMMYLGIISDILDGIFARKMKVSTSELRQFDSKADAVFRISIIISLWILNPIAVKDHIFPIMLIFIMEVLVYIISFIKFRKGSSTHALLRKLWAISMVVGFTFILGFNYFGVPFYMTIVLGLLSQIDVILITLLLPKWDHDIPSTYHAILIRK